MRSRRISCVCLWILAVTVLAPVSGASQGNILEKWTKKDLKVAISSAKSAEDHARIAQYYRLDAARLEREAQYHAALAKKYGSRNSRHCRWLSTEYAKKAEKDRALANIHDDMAKSVTQREASRLRR
jgi:hypothetical protein